MGASGDSQRWWTAAGAGNAARDGHCRGNLALQSVQRGGGAAGRAEHRASLPALGILAAGITRGHGVITAQRPRTQRDCGQESPGGLGGLSAECWDGPRGGHPGCDAERLLAPVRGN